jgi:transporter family-2 protein
VVSVGLFVTGRVLASLALDAFGLLGVARDPLGPVAAAGALGVIAGMGLIVRAQAPAAAPAAPGRQGRAGRAGRGAWVLLGLLAGAALPVQGAVNAQLRADLGASAAAGAFSFVVATATMAVVLLSFLALHRTARPRLAPLRRLLWWGWLGGFAGATYVTSVFLLIPRIGAATTIGLTVAGQQLGSLLVDHWGLLRLPRRPATRRRLAGVALLVTGVALVQLT